MKKIVKRICYVLLCIGIGVSFFGSVTTGATYLYSGDGRVIDVPSDEVEKYIQLGWNPYCAVTLYSLDGRTIEVWPNQVPDYKAVGWYEEPSVMIYAPYGKSAVVPTYQLEAYKSVGWYEEPVSVMYSADGRWITVATSQVSAFEAVGWYENYVVTMYAPDGRSINIYRYQVPDYKRVGWYLPAYNMSNYTLYNDKINAYRYIYYTGNFAGNDKYENEYIVRQARNNDGRLFCALYDVDKNGVPELIFSEYDKYDNAKMLMDIYTLYCGNLVKLFDSCDFGERSRLHILADGTLLNEGSNGAKAYGCEVFKLRENGALTRTMAYYCDDSGPHPAYFDSGIYMSLDAYYDNLYHDLYYAIESTLDWYII